MKIDLRKWEDILLSLVLAVGFSACANRTLNTVSDSSVDTPAMPREAQLATSEDAHVVSRIQFEEGQSVLTPKAQTEINHAIEQARAMGQDDIAESLAMQLEAMDYMNNWDEEITSKAKVLAELVEHHIDEEEKEFFPEVRRFTIPIELQILRDEYLVQCEQYLNQVVPQGLVPALMKGAVVRVAQYVNRLNA
ncbi:MAG: hypothetical protein ACK5Y2_02230 [Bdellovibrionales bacterium]